MKILKGKLKNKIIKRILLLSNNQRIVDLLSFPSCFSYYYIFYLSSVVSNSSLLTFICIIWLLLSPWIFIFNTSMKISTPSISPNLLRSQSINKPRTLDI